MSEHTKGKITVDGWNGRAGVCIWDDKLNHILTAEIPYPLGKEQQSANAARVKLCWNSHDTLTKQRDDLLAACKIGLAYIHAEISGVPRPINDLQDDKEILKSAIDSCT